MNVPRVVIAGLYGEGGKTTVATGIMGAFMKKGLNVQAFKSGPDHIDATYHARAISFATEVSTIPSSTFNWTAPFLAQDTTMNSQ